MDIAEKNKISCGLRGRLPVLPASIKALQN
jgi:hypothetical protein